MNKLKKLVAVPVAFIFALTCFSGCRVSQTKLATAKDYVSKASFYLVWAKTLVSVAEAYYSGNVKVDKALEATKKAIDAVQVALELIAAGIDRDQKVLSEKVTELVTAAFALSRAIKEAQK